MGVGILGRVGLGVLSGGGGKWWYTGVDMVKYDDIDYIIT